MAENGLVLEIRELRPGPIGQPGKDGKGAHGQLSPQSPLHG